MSDFERFLEWLTKAGAAPLNGHDGAWLGVVDEHWAVAANGHGTPQDVQIPDVGTVSIAPFTFHVYYNGWPAGILVPALGGFEGEFAAGSAANEDTFMEAIEAALSETEVTG